MSITSTQERPMNSENEKTSKRGLLRNLHWNWAGILGDTVVSFLLCPYLLSHLGPTHYGAWIMIGSLTGYFGLLDLGIRGSVGRYVAFYRAKNDPRAASEIVSTAAGLLTLAGIIGALGTGLAGVWADRVAMGEFSPEEMPALRLALLLAGLNLGIQLPLNVADGVLWGCQRFDRLNSVRIPFDLARGGLSALVVAFDGGLVALSAVALGLTIVSGLAKFRLARQAAPEISWRFRGLDRARMKEVCSFGLWSTLRSITTMIPTRVTPLLIGSILGVAMVTPMSLAARLIAAASAILVAATGVITPHATALHAADDQTRQRRLMIDGGKYSLAAASVFLVLFVGLGRPLIHLWVGPELDLAYTLLVLLFAGRWVSMSQVVTRGIITAQAKHRALAMSSVAQAVVTLGLGLLLMRSYGVLGMAAAIALGDAVCEGLFSLVYGCRGIGLSVGEYLREILGALFKSMSLPVAALTVALTLRPATTWFDVIAYGAAFALLSIGSVVWINEGSLDLLAARFRRNRPENAPCVT